jgi:hypothetical protein
MNPTPIHLPPHLQHLKGEELHAAIKQEYRVQAIAFILRQTEYTEDVANERLDALKDPVKVVKEYLGESKVQSQPVCNSKNKMKYGEIRKFMDAGARQYNMQKEINEQRRKYQEYIEQQQQKHLEQQQQKHLEQQQHLEQQEPQEPQEHQEQQEHQEPQEQQDQEPASP